MSGVGKSRLILEALGRAEGDKTSYRSLSDLVMYVLQSEFSSESINTVVQSLVDSGQRAIVVVDDCDFESHKVLTDMVTREGSLLSLITIDHDTPTDALALNTIKVAEAPSSVTAAIINRISPDLHSEDRRRLEHFSEGFPKIAILVTQAWDRSTPIAHATDDALVDAFIAGRRTRDRGLMLKSAALLATFYRLGVDGALNDQLQEVAILGRYRTFDDLYAGIAQLVDRNVAQRRGRLAVLQPRPIALKLAERQWKEWSPATWDRVLSGDINRELRISAARQLAQLNNTDIAKKVVAHVCRFGGPFNDFEDSSWQAHAAVLSALAEIGPDIVVQQIERSLEQIDDLSRIGGDARRHLVGASETIAFHADTFREGASLLLRLAVAENEPWANNATGQFTSLFSMLLGGTEATGNTRLSLLDELADTEDDRQRDILVAALTTGCNLGHFSRVVGAEVQGSKPALVSWRPATNDEAIECIEGCVLRLSEFAFLDEKSGLSARAGLGQNLRILVTRGFIDIVERIVDQANDRLVYWPELISGLNMVLAYDGERIGVDVSTRVRQLVAKLQPQDLAERVRYLVTDMPWDYPGDKMISYEERNQLQVEAVQKLAGELAERPHILADSLVNLSRGQQRMAYVLGASLTNSLESPQEWLGTIEQAVACTPRDECNFDLLAGYLSGLNNKYPEVVDAFKIRAAGSSDFAPAFPAFFRGLPVSFSDVNLLMDSLHAGLLPPDRVLPWAFVRVLDKVPTESAASLLDALIDSGVDGFIVSVNMLGTYIINESVEPKRFAPQIRKLAANAVFWSQAERQRLLGPHMTGFYFERIMNRMLALGREDTDANATALALAKVVSRVQDLDDKFLITPVLPKLLSDYLEVAWPLIGQAIISSDPLKTWRLEQVFGDSLSFGLEANPAILNLPEYTLFAWCHAHPESAPAFAAKIIPILTTHQSGDPKLVIHPTMARLLDEFGDREDVQREFESNLHTFGTFGSMSDHYAIYRAPLSELLQHSNPKVCRWAKGLLRRMDATIKDVRGWEEEADAKWEM